MSQSHHHTSPSPFKLAPLVNAAVDHTLIVKHDHSSSESHAHFRLSDPETRANNFVLPLPPLDDPLDLSLDRRKLLSLDQVYSILRKNAWF